MSALVASRVRLAVSVALVSAGSFALLVVASSAARAGGSATLVPDLVTLAIGDADLMIQAEGKRTVLRLTNEVANRGAGPLELFPSAVSQNCDGDGDPANDRDAAQRLYADSNASGAYERDVDGVDSERGFGCMRYHAVHDHWHVLDFVSYELRREATGKRALSSRKVGFCVVDSRLAFPGAGAATAPVYPFGPPGSVGCDGAATQGLSVGFADAYVFALPGQQLDVGGLRRDRYCLISRVDPADQLAELDDDNNVRRARIALRPKRPSVRRLPGKCRI